MSEVHGGDHEPFPKGTVILSSKAIGFEPNERKYLKKLFQFSERSFQSINSSKEENVHFISVLLQLLDF